MARVLVTGATGFIGRHLVPHLLKRGDRVRCLIHFKEERVPGAECVAGDITVPQTLHKAVAGIDVVYHLAGATLVTSAHRYRQINSMGTRNLGEACARLTSPPTLVFLSSLAAAGPTLANRPVREADLPAPISAYGRSKLLAERWLRQLAGRLPITLVRPPGVFGPGDPNMIGLFQTVRWGVNFIPGSVNHQLGFIYVDDLIESLPIAAEKGERLPAPQLSEDQVRGLYYLTLEERPTLETMGQIAAGILAEMGAAPGKASIRSIVIPPTVGKFIGRCNDFAARLAMRPLLLTSDKMREALAGSWICTSGKAHQAWGFSCRTSMAQGMHLTAQWYRRQGLL